jgi:hypothetical protein
MEFSYKDSNYLHPCCGSCRYWLPHPAICTRFATASADNTDVIARSCQFTGRGNPPSCKWGALPDDLFISGSAKYIGTWHSAMLF